MFYPTSDTICGVSMTLIIQDTTRIVRETFIPADGINIETGSDLHALFKRQQARAGVST